MRTALIAVAAAILTAAPVAAYCPEFMYNQTACSCTEYVDGAIIRCSGPEGPQMVEKLKKHPTEVRELALEHANILEIGPRAFGSLRIKKLVLDNNRIRAIQVSAFHGLDTVLQELSINNNKLPEVPTEAIDGLRALNILSLRCNEIGNLTAGTFVNLPTLIEVNLGCNKISNIAADAFQEVRSSIQNINLDNNQLKHIPSKAVENMTQLIGLHLKYNKINKLEKDQLSNLPNLAMLTLSGNKIASIDKDFVKNASSLRYVYLNDNEIEKAEPMVMKQFNTVEILDMAYNKIGDIAEKQFSVLDNVQHLNLEGNRIANVAPGAFAGTPLLLLWLPHNCLSNVSADMFKGIPFVKHISMAHNNIVNVTAYSFAHLVNLHTLDLTYNLISYVENSALMGADFLTSRLQENPLICQQDGFHVMNGRDALFLNPEPNLVCKEKPRKPTCPQKGNKPAAPQCHCSAKSHKKSTTTPAPSSTTSSATPAAQPSTKVTQVFDERQLVAAMAAAANLAQQQQKQNGNSGFDVQKAAEAARRLNMERFMRLSKTPADPSLMAAHATAPEGARQRTFLERQRGLLARTELAQVQQTADRASKTKFSVSAPVEFSHDEAGVQVHKEEEVSVPVAHIPSKN